MYVTEVFAVALELRFNRYSYFYCYNVPCATAVLVRWGAEAVERDT